MQQIKAPVPEERRPLTLYDSLFLMFLFLTFTQSAWFIIPAFIFFPLWIYLYDRALAWRDYENALKELENEHNQEIAEDETEAE